MASISSLPIFLAVTFLLILKLTPTTQTNQNETRLHLYCQERTKPPNATAIKVVSSSIDQSDPVYTFGNMFVFDDPVTEDLDPTSRLLGRVQGTLSITSLDGFDGLFTFNLLFTDLDPWTGSSLTIIGRNQTQKAVKELPVVGGTGQFRSARGYVVLTRLSSTDAPNGILTFEMEVTIFNN